jgi:dihydrofolate reductase
VRAHANARWLPDCGQNTWRLQEDAVARNAQRHSVASTHDRTIEMSKLIGIMTMSLDGYVADREGSVAAVMRWYMASGDTEVHTGGSDPMTLRMSAASATQYRQLTAKLGAVLTGRRTFDTASGWGGQHAWGPAFVLTHHVPPGWPRPDSTVTFVTDGLESAVRQAKAAAAGKSVGVHGANTIQQLLNAGLLDELQLDVAALLLGGGVRLFDERTGPPVVLGTPTAVVGVGVTHLRYVVRSS